MQTLYKGIVTAIKRASESRNDLYTIVSDKVINARSPLMLELGDAVTVNGINDDMIGHVEQNGKASAEDYEREIAKAVDGLRIIDNIEEMKGAEIGKPYGKSFGMMSEALNEAAVLFARTYLSGAPIVVRFHHDGDGSGGAVALYRALSKLEGSMSVGHRGVSWMMHRGVEYDAEAFYSDSLEFKNYQSLERPLILIIDFGTAPGSEASIREAAKGCRLMMLDHHPMYDGFPKAQVTKYINPWEYGSDTNFTAGLLACFFSESICRVDTSDMRVASMISDFSSFADRGDRIGMRDAVILDYLTNVAGRQDSSIGRLTPSYIEGILKDKSRADEIFYTASNTMNEMLDLGVKSVRPYKCRNGITAFVLEFGAMPRNSSGYPLPGRYSSKLQERLESINGKSTITILYYGSYVTMRISKEISKEVGILKIIDRLVRGAGYAGSGGGHNEAASIKVSGGDPVEVVGVVLRELGATP